MKVKNEIISGETGNTYVGPIACKLATHSSCRLDGVVYSIVINRIEPRIELFPCVEGLLPKRGLVWGSQAFFDAVESRNIILL